VSDFKRKLEEQMDINKQHGLTEAQKKKHEVPTLRQTHTLQPPPTSNPHTAL